MHQNLHYRRQVTSVVYRQFHGYGFVFHVMVTAALEYCKDFSTKPVHIPSSKTPHIRPNANIHLHHTKLHKKQSGCRL